MRIAGFWILRVQKGERASIFLGSTIERSRPARIALSLFRISSKLLGKRSLMLLRSIENVRCFVVDCLLDLVWIRWGWIPSWQRRNALSTINSSTTIIPYAHVKGFQADLTNKTNHRSFKNDLRPFLVRGHATHMPILSHQKSTSCRCKRVNEDELTLLFLFLCLSWRPLRQIFWILVA